MFYLFLFEAAKNLTLVFFFQKRSLFLNFFLTVNFVYNKTRTLILFSKLIYLILMRENAIKKRDTNKTEIVQKYTLTNEKEK